MFLSFFLTSTFNHLKWKMMIMIIVFKRHLYPKTMYHFCFFCLFENFLNLNPHQWIGIIFRFAKSKKQWSIIVVRKVENFLFTRYETKRKFPKRKKIIHRNHHHYYGNLFNLWRKNLNLMNFDLEKKHIHFTNWV